MASSQEIDLRAILNGYADEVRDGLVKAQKNVAKETAEMVRARSPRKNGKYAADWAFKKSDNGQVVYNKSHYQLSHLLEFGHALRNGGRSQAFPHIKPAETFAINEFTKQAKQVIDNAK
ncbi:MAG: HK97 gp10 family phage protein [Lactobacillus sp.]|nr:HK97 gp10 family phage protein [Lactobacillus sp.]